MPKSCTPSVAVLVLLIAGAAPALGQPGQPTDPSPQPALHEEATAKRGGDSYPLSTCPISGGNLGSMGEPVVKLYEGREVRFCCGSCPPKFEKDLAANLAKLDEAIIKDQAPLYPLKTSVVTGKDLPSHPYEFAYGNRLVRLGAESEKPDFLKDPKKNLAALDKAVVEQQGKDYPIKTCPVSKEEFGGDMDKPMDLVIAGRLVRLCCKECKKDVEKNPAKFIAMVDAARKGSKHGADHDHKHDKGHGSDHDKEHGTGHHDKHGGG